MKEIYNRANLGTIPSFVKYITTLDKLFSDIKILHDNNNTDFEKPLNNKQTVYEEMNVFLEIKNIYTQYVLFNK